MIQKLSSIVSSGTTESTITGTTGSAFRIDGKLGVGGSYTTLHGISKTKISELLAPPSEPKPPSKLAGGIVQAESKLGKPIMIIILIFGLISIIFPLATGELEGYGMFCLGFGLLCFGMAAYNLFGGHTDKDSLDYLRSIDNWKTQMARWQSAMKIWDDLYYCARDNIVFNPVDGNLLTPEQLRDFWYD